MTVAVEWNELTGSWRGENSLWLFPGEPARVSRSEAEISLVASGQFLSIRYTWADGVKPQEGLLLVGGNASSGEASAAWVDSWHNADRMMICSGTVFEAAGFKVKGRYSVEDGPDWGWEIRIFQGKDLVRLEMDNITPEGQAARAVECVYSRAG